METPDCDAVAIAVAAAAGEHDAGDDFGRGEDSGGGDDVNCYCCLHRPDFVRCSDSVGKGLVRWPHPGRGLWADRSGSAEECGWMAAMAERVLPRCRRRRTRCS